MKLRKDDPVFYKVHINKLIKQAEENGLSISVSTIAGNTKLDFGTDTGEIASATLITKANQEDI